MSIAWPTTICVVRSVEGALDMPSGCVVGRSRKAPVARARFAVMWVAAVALLRTSGQIGRALGRDHSTILHGLRRAETLRRSDDAFRDLTDRLVTAFTGEAA